MTVEMKKKRVRVAEAKPLEVIGEEISSHIRERVDRMVERDKQKPQKPRPEFRQNEKDMRKTFLGEGKRILVVVPHREKALKWISLFRGARLPVHGLHSGNECTQFNQEAYICTFGYLLVSKIEDFNIFDSIVMDGCCNQGATIFSSLVIKAVVKNLMKTGNVVHI